MQRVCLGNPELCILTRISVAIVEQEYPTYMTDFCGTTGCVYPLAARKPTDGIPRHFRHERISSAMEARAYSNLDARPLRRLTLL